MTSPTLETDKPKTALLEAYFERIGYTGAVTNTFEVFQALHKAHVDLSPVWGTI